MDYVIAVRTYKRAVHFRSNTLQVIKEQGLLDRLFVFVGSDLEEYKEMEPDLRYIAVPPGGHNAIRAICEYFPRGTPIFFMDDDLANFKMYDLSSDSFKIDGLHEVIVEGFSHAPFCFGFLTNKKWLRVSPRIRPTYGCMPTTAFGAFNEPELINTTHAHLDDTLRAIQYLKIGRVPHVFPGASFKTYYGKTDGGLQASGDRNNTLQVCHEVADQVAGWCEEIIQHPNGLYHWKWAHPSKLKKMVKAILSS